MGRLASAISKAVSDAGLSVRRVAEDARIGYDALASYNAGRREPSPDVVEQVAAALERRAQKIMAAAARLRRSA